MAVTKGSFKTRVKLADGKRVVAEVPRPTIVGVTAAAGILGVPKSNVSRLVTQGRMPDPLPKEGPGADMWIKDEVQELGAVLEAERVARAAKRVDDDAPE